MITVLQEGNAHRAQPHRAPFPEMFEPDLYCNVAEFSAGTRTAW